MTPPIHVRRRRLSDAIRAALNAGDLHAARRLALEHVGIVIENLEESRTLW
jgi:hypothetical protein